MRFSLKESFDQHSKIYGIRVRNRKKYPKLTLEDQIIVQFLKHSWPNDKKGTLIDAGCGTGDRLQLFFSEQKLPFYWFNEIIGLDYSLGMLKLAKIQQLANKPLYTNTELINLEKNASGIKGDLVLMLWTIINSSSRNAPKLLSRIAKTVSKNGYLIYDGQTTSVTSYKIAQPTILRSHPELKPNNDNQIFWYKREDDNTIGYLKLFSPREFNYLAKATKLPLKEVWGYNERDLIPQQILLENGTMNEDQVAQYTNIILIHQNS